MRSLRCLALVVPLVSGVAAAQYPPRGQPDPAFNNGRPRILAVTAGGSGLDRASAVVPVSPTRFAVIGARPREVYGFVAIVDTTPERVATFDAIVPVPTRWQLLASLAAADGKVVLGGSILDPLNVEHASLDVREVGVDAVPTLAARGTLVTASAGGDHPRFVTTAVLARSSDSGALVIWQARTALAADFRCGTTRLVRVDHASSLLTERYALDVAAALQQPCMAVFAATHHASQPADPPGTTAVLVGAACRISAAQRLLHACIARILDNGSSLAVDRGFGIAGVARFGADDGQHTLIRGLRSDGAGRIVASADRQSDEGGQLAGLLIALDPTGRTDLTFGNAGVVTIPAAAVGDLAMSAEGNVQVVGSSGAPLRPNIHYFDRGAGTLRTVALAFLPTEPSYSAAFFQSVASLPAGGAVAVGGVTTAANAGATLIARLAGERQIVTLLEYHHAAFDHYFVTSLPDEIRKLDDGTFAGWRRTGESFAALPVGSADGADVCRFFSETFAPRSSHFYTPFAAECDGLKAGNVWSYEGNVFALTSTNGAGSCPPGTGPLFRLYNDGRGGAPNHRLTTTDASRAREAARGWIGEGSGTPPVFACVPH